VSTRLASNGQEREDMKKLAKKKLVLDAATIQILAGDLRQIAGGKPPCTDNLTGCSNVP
jgi:hypothetical protein